MGTDITHMDITGRTVITGLIMATTIGLTMATAGIAIITATIVTTIIIGTKVT
jgi:hypothetical protein